jgi:hypothetical protein
MASKASYFLEKTLGEDFLKSLEKFELWKPGTKSTIDHEELRTALQIVPRTIMALLIRELSPMNIGDNHKVQLPVPGGAVLNVSKQERDVYSGDITQGSKVIVDFKLRALPGVGLIIMSAFELYDMENLINSAPEAPVNHDVSSQVQKLIDERLALHDLIGRVVDKKIMEKDAVHQLVLRKLTEMVGEGNKIKEQIADVTKIAKHPGNAGANEYMRGMANGLEVANATAHKKEPEFVEPPMDKSAEKKKRPLAEFLDKRKNKHEYKVVMAKGEQVNCPDCSKNIFDGKVFSGCICLGDDMERKVFIKKEQDGIKVRFSRGWDEENIEMLLEVLRKKRG